MVNSHGRFVWYELMTTDIETAKTFYGIVKLTRFEASGFTI
jgi:predicted enzyme related to lactoylglutathione lyase